MPIKTLFTSLALCEGKQPVFDGFPSQMASNAMWSFDVSFFIQAVDQPIKLPVVWYTLMLLWCHCYVAVQSITLKHSLQIHSDQPTLPWWMQMSWHQIYTRPYAATLPTGLRLVSFLQRAMNCGTRITGQLPQPTTSLHTWPITWDIKGCMCLFKYHSPKHTPDW